LSTFRYDLSVPLGVSCRWEDDKTDRRTDMIKLIVAFRSFAKELDNYIGY
jgi:hypothetical protein